MLTFRSELGKSLKIGHASHKQPSVLGRHSQGEAGNCVESKSRLWVERLIGGYKVLFLFTASDFKTIVFPQAAFGIVTSLSGQLLLDGPTSPSIILLRIPLVVLWVWINLLPFAINNQRQPLAIREDKINKPWRPLPSGSISSKSAQQLMYLFYTLALLVSIGLGCEIPCIALMALGWFYNDMGGADYSCVVRNLMNAAGYASFAMGATITASARSTLSKVGYEWFCVVALIVFSTVQMQDIPDQEGDSDRGRKTVPLVVGDRAARWTVAIGVLFWSLITPTFWEVYPKGYIAPCMLGLVVVGRVLSKHTVPEDRWTFRLWNLWMVAVYLLPLVRKLTV